MSFVVQAPPCHCWLKKRIKGKSYQIRAA
jgi:hypothetical protein